MAHAVKSAVDELDDLAGHSVRSFVEAMRDLIRALAYGKQDAVSEARGRIEKLIGDTLILSDLLGRKRLLMEADAKRSRNADEPKGRMLFSDDVSPILPRVEFSEAIADIVSREPRLATTAENVEDIYRSRHAFALARSTDLKLTKRIQGEIATLAKEGVGEREGVKRLLDATDDWTRAYAETVYRTNLNRSYNAGRFQQASDPDVAEVIGALKFVSARDEDVRKNHAAADGLIAGTHDPIWSRLAPPLGYNCRCSVIMIDRFDLEKMGLLKGNHVLRKEPAGIANAGPDKGFSGGRPDRGIYS